MVKRKTHFGMYVRLETLFSQLAQASKIYESEISTTDHGRVAAFAAVRAITDFIDSFDDAFHSRLSQPLRALSFALLDLEGGRQPPMLTATKSSHRPAATTTQQYIRGYLAFAMEVLMRADFSRKEAAKLVARKANARGIAEVKFSSTQIAGWRDSVIGNSEPSEAKDRFDAMLVYYQTANTNWSEGMVDGLIALLPDAIPELRFIRVERV